MAQSLPFQEAQKLALKLRCPGSGSSFPATAVVSCSTPCYPQRHAEEVLPRIQPQWLWLSKSITEASAIYCICSVKYIWPWTWRSKGTLCLNFLIPFWVLDFSLVKISYYFFYGQMPRFLGQLSKKKKRLNRIDGTVNQILLAPNLKHPLFFFFWY